MKAVRHRVFAFAAALAFSAGAFAFCSPAGNDQQKGGKPVLNKSQSQTRQPAEAQDDNVIKLGTDLVTLDVTVVEQSSNKPVMDLSQTNFQVYEDKVAQKIEFFSRDQVPVSLVFA